MKYKVGDKVRVRKDVVVNELYVFKVRRAHPTH